MIRRVSGRRYNWIHIFKEQHKARLLIKPIERIEKRKKVYSTKLERQIKCKFIKKHNILLLNLNLKKIYINLFFCTVYNISRSFYKQ